MRGKALQERRKEVELCAPQDPEGKERLYLNFGDTVYYFIVQPFECQARLEN